MKIIWKRGKIVLLAGFVFVILLMNLIGCAVMSNYESAYPKTDVGVCEIKKIPKSVMLRASEDGSYNDKANSLFRKLFNYIKKNNIPMTVPVESGIEKAEMFFYVSENKKGSELHGTETINVIRIPDRIVASIGSRGSYSKKNIEKQRNKLAAWLVENIEYEADGEAYAVYWNSPFTIWFVRRFEVHIPVKEKNK